MKVASRIEMGNHGAVIQVDIVADLEDDNEKSKEQFQK